jgi:hypothetical protein
MVRCISKTVSGKRCKLHRLIGEETCTIHSHTPAHVPCENIIVYTPKVDVICTEPKYIQSQEELLVEKKEQQQIWKSLGKPELIINNHTNIPVSNLIVSIRETHDNNMPCGHSCTSITNCGTVGAGDKCCGCADTRPLDTKYMRNVEGVGVLNVGLREDVYCVTCKGYWATAMPINERFNSIMNTDVPVNVAPALGRYGLDFCKEIQENITWMVHMHNALYSRSIELSITEETSSTEVND